MGALTTTTCRSSRVVVDTLQMEEPEISVFLVGDSGMYNKYAIVQNEPQILIR